MSETGLVLPTLPVGPYLVRANDDIEELHFSLMTIILESFIIEILLSKIF